MRTFAIGISSVLCLGAVFATGHAFKQVRETQKQANASVAAAKADTRRSTMGVAEQYAKTPLAFEANLGQANSEAKFLARGSGYEIFLTPKESVFVLQTPGQVSKPKTQKFAATSSASILRMSLVG